MPYWQLLTGSDCRFIRRSPGQPVVLALGVVAMALRSLQ